MGCSTLYHLAEMGVSDAVWVERNPLPSGTTWHSAAQVRALRSSSNLTRMIQYSVELYSRLEKETGQQVGWIQEGSLSIATTPGRLDHIRRQEALAKAYGVSALSVTSAEARDRWPLMNADDVLGAVWSPDDGRVSPSDVCGAFRRLPAALPRVWSRTPQSSRTSARRLRACRGSTRARFLPTHYPVNVMLALHSLRLPKLSKSRSWSSLRVRKSGSSQPSLAT